MKLSECIHGVLVRDFNNGRIGMIIGITNNRPDCYRDDRNGVEYAIPLVQWSDGQEYGIHHCNIEKFKGYL